MAAHVASQEGVSPSFICPLTLEIMSDPVTAADGHSYEHEAIAKWLRTSSLSPLTGERLPNKNLTRSHALRNAIQEHEQRCNGSMASIQGATVHAPALHAPTATNNVPAHPSPVAEAAPTHDTPPAAAEDEPAPAPTAASAPAPPPPLPPLPPHAEDGVEARLPNSPFDAANAAHMRGALDTCRKLVNAPALQALISQFRAQHCDAFDASTDENKLEYTTLHEEFVALVDSELTEALNERLGPHYDMAAFLAALPAFLDSGAAGSAAVDDETDDESERAATLPETLHVLRRFTAFEAFREDMLAAQRAKREAAEAMAEGMALYFKVVQ